MIVFFRLSACILLLSATTLPSLAQTDDDDLNPFEEFEMVQQFSQDAVCPEERHSLLQKKLSEAFEADQSDRKGAAPQQPGQLSANDVERRKIVSQIAAEGCLKEGMDFYQAALIYQHGQRPYHYFTALKYATEALDLGFEGADWLRKVAIDRYLKSLGRKQIYASQVVAPVFYKVHQSDEDLEPCLWPVQEDYLIDFEKDLDHMPDQCGFPAKDSIDLHKALMGLSIRE